jgi:hypothetical protein
MVRFSRLRFPKTFARPRLRRAKLILCLARNQAAIKAAPGIVVDGEQTSQALS